MALNQKSLYKSIAYFDCQFGASGDMLLAALLDLGLDFNEWLKEINNIALIKDNVTITVTKELRCGINANRLIITEKKSDVTERNLACIVELIKQANYKANVTTLALNIFTNLALAEAKIHGIDINEVHFHEIGAIDSIIDILGFSIAYDLLNISECKTSPLAVGSGTITTAHGIYPIPAPATAQLIQDFKIPLSSFCAFSEALTPTACAILATITQKWTPYLEITTIVAQSYGAGFRDTQNYPNICRIVLGQTAEPNFDLVYILECNIDDLAPYILAYVQEQLLVNGALEVFLTPCISKKNRCSFVLTVICKEEVKALMESIIFQETTTLGIRNHQSYRQILKREFKEVYLEPDYKINLKVAYESNGKIVKLEPEYDDCAKYAKLKKIPLKEVIQEAKKLGHKLYLE